MRRVASRRVAFDDASRPSARETRTRTRRTSRRASTDASSRTSASRDGVCRRATRRVVVWTAWRGSRESGPSKISTRDARRRARVEAAKRGERRASLTTCARVGDGGCVTRVLGRRDGRRGERRAELVTRPARRDDVHRQCYASHRSREKNRVKGRWWCRRCGRGGMREPRWVME